MPPDELGGELHVLPPLSDREKELLLGDDHLHALPGLVHQHPDDLGRLKGVADEPGGVLVPGDDVDPLAAQLLHDALHAGSLHADARAHGVDVPVPGAHGDLGAEAGLPRHAEDGDHPLVDLGDLLLEELEDHPRVGPGEKDLRTPGRLADVLDVGPDPVALAVPLAGNLLRRGHDRLGLPEVDDEAVALVPLHDAVQDLPLPADELVVDDLALRVLHLLHDDLARRLGGDPPEILGAQPLAEAVAHLRLGVEDLRLLEGHRRLGVDDRLRRRSERQDLELPGVGVVGRLEDLVHPVLLPRGGLEGFLDRRDDDGLVDPFFLAQLGNDLSHVQDHRFFFPFPKSSSCVTSRFAFRISPYGTRYVVPSATTSIPSPSQAESSPTRCRRPSRGARRFTRTRFPRDRSKCSGRRSRRVTPGEDTSST